MAHESTANSSHKSRYDVDSEDYRLTIGDVSPADDGIYDCVMYNEREEFIIKSKKRFKLAVQGWWKNVLSDFFLIVLSESGHVLLAQNSH